MAVTMRGSRTIDAPRGLVWAALNDVDCLRRCIPHCRSLERTSDRSFALAVQVRLGLHRVAFEGTIEVFDVVPMQAYGLRGVGVGQLGRAMGTTRIMLTDIPDGCRVGYEVDAEAQGMLASLGPFIIAGTAKALTGRFAGSLADLLAGATQLAPLPAAWSSPTISSAV